MSYTDEVITLAHGGGGRLYHQLVEEVFLPIFDNAYLRQLNDSALCPSLGTALAMTTDSYVVQPRFFPGGDIGRLAVCGTVNDLTMSGAKPAYLSVGMILEAGLPIAELRRICESMAAAAKEAGVSLVTGDTKVVEKGKGDGIYINTAGIGLFPEGKKACPQKIQAGDSILVSGTIGDHGLCILAARERLEFDPPLRSDAAPLHDLAAAVQKAVPDIHAMRDPTRGGVASVANEWCGNGLSIEIAEEALPLSASVSAVAGILGLDPLYVANEGKFMLAVSESDTEAALRALRSHPLGENAAVIGRVVEDGRGLAYVRTPYGSQRLLDLPYAEQLPRIC
ncbi:MAG: hydrogenase expression/formation protein HypE [Firmicutes bacterium]|nr:hydrogenase expression/formation protein HypE [Bacillota bacterium]